MPRERHTFLNVVSQGSGRQQGEQRVNCQVSFEGIPEWRIVHHPVQVSPPVAIGFEVTVSSKGVCPTGS